MMLLPETEIDWVVASTHSRGHSLWAATSFLWGLIRSHCSALPLLRAGVVFGLMSRIGEIA